MLKRKTLPTVTVVLVLAAIIEAILLFWIMSDKIRYRRCRSRSVRGEEKLMKDTGFS